MRLKRKNDKKFMETLNKRTWIKCNTTHCLLQRNGYCSKGMLVCDNTHCMKNIDGFCVHRKCPMDNPEYKNPEQVAKEVEIQMQEQLRMEQELKNLKNKKR